MGRRVVPLTLDLLDRLDPAESPVRTCLTWALDPVRRGRLAPDDVAAHVEAKDAWVSELLREWGSCGRVVLGDTEPRQVTGVLDWEMATVGDPLMDLGGALAYWVQADDDEWFRRFCRQPSDAPGMWSRWEIVQRYTDRSGLTVTADDWRFYEVFGIFRLAVIAQQIWYRYVLGQTHNEAYAIFGPAAQYLLQRSRQIIGG